MGHLSKKSIQWAKIIIIFSVLACVLSFYPTTAFAQKDLSALVKKVVPSVVVINVFDKGGKLKVVGTGFFIKEDGALVTNYHVIDGGIRAEAKLSSGEVLPIEGIISEDKEGDLVLLTLGVKGRSFPPLKIAGTKIEAGESVVVIGSPFGLEGTVSDGIVSAVRDLPNLGKILQITAPISKGSSGSPVLNMKGEVVGIAISYIKEGQSLNFAVSVDRVNSLLSHQKAKVQKFVELEKGGGEKWLDSAHGLYLLGTYFLQVGRYDDGIKFLRKSIQKQPDYGPAHLNLGWIYMKLGRFQDAIEEFKQAARLSPDDAASYHNLGLVYHTIGRSSEAIQAFKQVVRITPNDFKAHYNLGYAYFKARRFTEAIEAYKQAIFIEPDCAEAYCGLGDIYGLSERFSEAIESYKHAIRVKPDFVIAHYNLGLAYLYFLENKRMALEQYKILKELDVEKANKLFDLIYK